MVRVPVGAATVAPTTTDESAAMSEPTPVVSTGPTPAAGRNLPAAIGVGVFLGALIVASLLVVPWGWVLLSTVFLMVGVDELRRGFAAGQVNVPFVPCLVATAVMGPAAYIGGAGALLLTMPATILLLVMWRAAHGLDGAARDVSAGAFVVGYAPFQAAFTALMVAQPDGVRRIVVFVLISIASDIGGYAVGVVAGRHPMAPTVSPKKSWEGFLGSMVACVGVGTVSVPLAFGAPWWAGAAMGFVVVWLATLGDLVESMIKRDLGIKDLGRILPGHGGIMDRIDSLLVVAPAAWWMMSVIAA
ncbi:Phosphatidate cytidylyltransferase [Austwickia sp. TVS 96-490-7B]|uniref:phosphatidate cytidylyltransferase n=1 Tax=Austwickia sp. TVS 96-490-7B TaxID=2830843 RepID=UPI001DD1D55B|nr:phosphatidate cytidylyltransferase [Austwickia sp. TVS 96-490-7B]MBW3084499.1 Phosphatidate cytidylyltransferase [Austwickia sp. TVS 96-490-7B]